MPAPAANANGHRRRELRRRVLTEEHTCALCGQPVDKTLTTLPGQHGPKCNTPTCTGCKPHPHRAEVDEDLPRSRGGSPLQRNNCHLMHRACNQYKSDMTLAEARTKRANTQPRTITASPGW